LTAAEVGVVTSTYSLASATVGDNFVDLLSGTGDRISDVMMMGMGAHVGEVIRLKVGGDWVAIHNGRLRMILGSLCTGSESCGRSPSAVAR
jgi:hypothetical protein